MLFIRLKITKGDGKDLTNGEKTAPVNYLIESLFKQADVYLNGILVTQSMGTYSYKSIFEVMVNYGPAAKQSHLTGSLFYKDTPGAMDETDPTTGGTNAGLKTRYGFTEKSNIVDLFGVLHCDMMFSERLLLNHVDVTVKLAPNTPAFCLMSGETNPDYKIDIQSAVLKIRAVKVSPTLQLLHLNELKKGSKAMYPIRRVDCKTYTIPRGNPSLHTDDLFNGHVPKRIVIGMVDSDAFNGSYVKKNFRS